MVLNYSCAQCLCLERGCYSLAIAIDSSSLFLVWSTSHNISSPDTIPPVDSVFVNASMPAPSHCEYLYSLYTKNAILSLAGLLNNLEQPCGYAVFSNRVMVSPSFFHRHIAASTTCDAGTMLKCAQLPLASLFNRMELQEFLKEQTSVLEIVANHLIMHPVHDECIKRFRIVDMLSDVVATMQQYGTFHRSSEIRIKSPAEFYKGTKSHGYKNKTIWKHAQKKST